jgi:hypothetical protein
MMKLLRSLSMTLRSIKLLTALRTWTLTTTTTTTTHLSVLRRALPKVARRASVSAPMLVATKVSVHVSRRRQRLATSRSSARARSPGRPNGSRLRWSRCLRCLPPPVLVELGQLPEGLLPLQMPKLALLVSKCSGLSSELPLCCRRTLQSVLFVCPRGIFVYIYHK